MSPSVVNRLSIAFGIAGLAALVAGGSLYYESRKHPASDTVAARAEEKEEDHGKEAKAHGEEAKAHGEEAKGHGEAGHGAEESDLDRPVEELFASKCEHDIAQYQCDECRYEVGVVKIPPEMLAKSGGILKTATPSERSFTEEFKVTGEVVINDERTLHATTPLAGVLKKVHVALGQRVEAGAPLFDIDSREVSDAKADYQKALSALEVEVGNARADYRKALAALDAEISEARGAHAKALASLDLARKSAQREQRLFEKNISARLEVEEADARLAEAKVDAEVAGARLNRLGLKGGESEESSTASAKENPSEVLVEAVNARARLLRLGMSAVELASLSRNKEGLAVLSSVEASDAPPTRQPEQLLEVANAKARLARLGVGQAGIEALAVGGGELSGIVTAYSPGAGVVLEKHGAVGEYVEAGADLLKITSFSEMWVWANLRDEEVAALRRAGNRAKAVFETSEGGTLDGRIDLSSAIVDETTRSHRVRVVLGNPGGELRPGMFVRVTLRVPGSAKVLSVPGTAVLTDEGRGFVFVHREGDFWVRRPVVQGRATDGHVEIMEGLSRDQTILTDGSFVAKSDVLRSKMGAGCAD